MFGFEKRDIPKNINDETMPTNDGIELEELSADEIEMVGGVIESEEIPVEEIEIKAPDKDGKNSGTA